MKATIVTNDNAFQSYPDILDVQQVQSALGIGRTWAYKLLEENRIKHFRIGHTYRIPKIALIEYVNQQAS